MQGDFELQQVGGLNASTPNGKAGKKIRRIRKLSQKMAFCAGKEEHIMTIAKIIGNREAGQIVACDVTTPVSEAISLLAGKRIGAVPVLKGGQVAGIVSERDIIYRLAEKGSDCMNLPVEAIMTSPVITVESTTTVDEALALMTKRRFRHFPVVDDGKLVAFISIGDLVKNKIDEVEHEAAALRDYIQTV